MKDLTEEEIKKHLARPCVVHAFDVVGSTNDLAKESEAPGETPELYVANQQTGGRGRLGRSFESPAGTGLYMTLSVKPAFDLGESTVVTMMAGVATARAIRKVAGVDAVIKWVNDVFYDGKKVCGILTEAAPDRMVVGIGVNCFPGSFPPELDGIAGSISSTQGAFSRGELAGVITSELLSLMDGIADPVRHMDLISEYRNLCFIIGEDILVHRVYGDDGIPAKAVGIDDDGGLIVRYSSGKKAGTEEVLRTGEVSVSV